MALAALEEELSRSGIVLRSSDALRRIALAPGELGFARAYVVGDLDIEGDVYAALALLERPRALARLVRELLPPCARSGSMLFAPCRRRRRRPACAAADTRRRATRPRSRTTTTSQTASTGLSSAPR
jgi:cyclopropane-fatty-acyl-phospholipid synthase